VEDAAFLPLFQPVIKTLEITISIFEARDLLRLVYTSSSIRTK
jgi:hypothetical protein